MRGRHAAAFAHSRMSKFHTTTSESQQAGLELEVSLRFPLTGLISADDEATDLRSAVGHVDPRRALRLRLPHQPGEQRYIFPSFHHAASLRLLAPHTGRKAPHRCSASLLTARPPSGRALGTLTRRIRCSRRCRCSLWCLMGLGVPAVGCTSKTQASRSQPSPLSNPCSRAVVPPKYRRAEGGAVPSPVPPLSTPPLCAHSPPLFSAHFFTHPGSLTHLLSMQLLQ